MTDAPAADDQDLDDDEFRAMARRQIDKYVNVCGDGDDCSHMLETFLARVAATARAFGDAAEPYEAPPGLKGEPVFQMRRKPTPEEVARETQALERELAAKEALRTARANETAAHAL